MATKKMPVNKMTGPPASAPAPALQKVSFGEIGDACGHRIVIYGPGGIGKTTLGCLAPGPVRFVDADESLPRLKGQLVEADVPLPGVVKVDSWTSLRAALKADGWEGTGTLVLDTVTKAEEWAVAYTLQMVPHEKGHKVHRLEDYGFGKGFQHVYDTFIHILNDLDKLCRKGIHVILIAHDCTTSVPNPKGDDWIRWEPRLQSPASGKGSIRLRLKEWADHVLFLGYDVEVKDGVGKGSGTRTLYTSELPHCMAKSRTTSEQIVISKGESPWDMIIK